MAEPVTIQPAIARALDRTTTDAELYALPVTVPVVEAGRVFGLSRDGTYDLLRRNAFPCRTIKVGRATKVPKVEILRALGLAETSAATVGGAGG